jgi:hypothetical protein
MSKFTQCNIFLVFCYQNEDSKNRKYNENVTQCNNINIIMMFIKKLINVFISVTQHICTRKAFT